MGKGRKPGPICHHLLLVALAFQGVTPDADDLASVSLLQVIEPVSRRTISWAKDGSPGGSILLHSEAESPSSNSGSSRDEVQNSTPDKLGLPAAPVGYGLLRHGPVRPLKFVRVDQPGQPTQSDHHRLTRHSGTIGTGSGLIQSLCRLTC